MEKTSGFRNVAQMTQGRVVFFLAYVKPHHVKIQVFIACSLLSAHTHLQAHTLQMPLLFLEQLLLHEKGELVCTVLLVPLQFRVECFLSVCAWLLHSVTSIYAEDSDEDAPLAAERKNYLPPSPPQSLQDEPLDNKSASLDITAAPQPSDPPLKWGAKYLQLHFQRASGKYVQADVVAQVAGERVRAAAQFALQSQERTLQGILDLVRSRTQNNIWRPVAAVEHILYDETELTVRVDSEKQKGKVFVVERAFSMLIQRLPLGTGVTGPNLYPASSYFLLEIPLSPRLRAGAGTAGEDVFEVLQHASPAVPMDDLFEFTTRLVESDEHGGNLRAEALLRLQRGPSWSHLHSLCLCHKVHASALKSFTLQEDVLSGLVHTAKVLSTAGSMAKFKEAARVLLMKRFAYRVEPLSYASSTADMGQSNALRENIMRFFLPALSHPRQRALLLVVQSFFNGNWEEKEVLEHRCPNSSCCRSPEHSRFKALILVTRFLTMLTPRVFNKGNWLNWSHSLGFFVFSDAMHAFLLDAFRVAFSRSAALELGESTMLNVSGHRNSGQRGFHTHEVTEETAATTNALLLGMFSMDLEAQAPLLDTDPVERQRVENARSMKQALQFMRHGMWRDVFMMRVTLMPEQSLIHALVKMTSAEWERTQIAKHSHLGFRDFRYTVLTSGGLVEASLMESMAIFKDTRVWAQFFDTEAFRSRRLKLLFRQAGVIFQLVHSKTQGFPYKLFTLLGCTPHELQQTATDLLQNTSSCLFDSWTASFLRIYDTVAKLTSVEALLVLEMVARRAMGSTFTTEALHSKNLRRALARNLTYKPDLGHLALTHAASACPSWTREGVDSFHSQRRRGRPTKPEAPKDSAIDNNDATVPHKRQRTGGGGAWRAFLHSRLAGTKMTADRLRDMSTEYAGLSVAERSHFTEMGRQGASCCCRISCFRERKVCPRKRNQTKCFVRRVVCKGGIHVPRVM
eukprot:1455615-Amphidinium_carterae.5